MKHHLEKLLSAQMRRQAEPLESEETKAELGGGLRIVSLEGCGIIRILCSVNLAAFEEMMEMNIGIEPPGPFHNPQYPKTPI